MKYRHRVLGFLCLLAAITYLDRVAISVAGPRIQEIPRGLLSPPALPVSLISRVAGACISTTRLSVESTFFTIVLRIQASGQRALLLPINVEQALGKLPSAVHLHNCAEVAERSDHQASF